MSGGLSRTCQRACADSANAQACQQRCLNDGIIDCISTVKEVLADDPNLFQRPNSKICRTIKKYDPKLELGRDDWTVQSVCSQALNNIPKNIQPQGNQLETFLEEFCSFGMLGRKA